MTALLQSLSIVVVINHVVPTSPMLARLASVLEGHAANFDLILVANGVDSEVGLRLKELVVTEPDASVVFLSQAVHDDLARLVGVEHAVGDYVLFFDPIEHDATMIPALLNPLHEGYDVVVGNIPELMVERPLFSRLLFETYLMICRRLTGIEIERHPSGLRTLSRAAALFVSSRPDGELLLRARSIGRGFPTTTVIIPMARSAVRHAWTAGKDWSRGLGLLLSVSTVPLRTASHIALLGGVISVIYAIYVIAIFLCKQNVAAGWTTISLQLAALMFIFSLLFLFLTEYIIQIHAANPPRSRRHLVLRELRSMSSRRSLRLNIVDNHGRFQLGAPVESAVRQERETM